MSYFELFYRLLIINTFTFGGGYTIVPVIKEEFSKKLNVVSSEDIDDMISIGQSIPGALAVSTSFLLGHKIKGILGAFVATLAALIPCLVIITVITYFYKAFITNLYIKFYLANIGATVSAVLLLSVLKMIKDGYFKYKIVFVIVFLISFILKLIFNIGLPFILIIAALLNIFINLVKEKGGNI